MSDEPEIPEAWRKPPDPNEKWSPSAPKPKSELSTGQKILKGIGWFFVILGGLILLGALLLLGTCLIFLANH
jgi:hypothetical protein